MALPTDMVSDAASSENPPPPPRPAPRKRTSWRIRILQGLIVFVTLCVLATGGAYVYVKHQLGRIKRVSIPTLVQDQPGTPMNVLLVGSDSRANTSGDLADETGKATEGERAGLSDTMMILHVDPGQGKAAILSIPRDLWVTVNGSHDRINAAFADGGPQLLISTIQDNLGIQINHYAEVDFAGFQNIVNTIGGLNVYIDAPAKDDNSGLDLPTAGCVQLNGDQALAYVRSRYYQYYEAGRWVYDTSSDFGRIKRQQDFIRRMLKKAVSSGLSNPLTLNRLISIGVDNLTIDSTMSTSDMVTLAKRFRSLDPDSVDMQTLPTTDYTTAGGAEVLLIDSGQAQPLIDNINGKPPPAPVQGHPADVQMRVLNGNGGEGSASKASALLETAGFQVTGTGDADAFTYAHTVIRYAPNSLAKAQLVQSYLTGGATLQADDTLGTVDVALIVGSDFTGIKSGTADTSPPTTATPQSPQPSSKGAPQPAC